MGHRDSARAFQGQRGEPGSGRRHRSLLLPFIIINIVVDMPYLAHQPAHQDGVDYGKDIERSKPSKSKKAASKGLKLGGWKKMTQSF